MMIHRESDEREREITEVERRRSLLMWLIPFSLNDSLVVGRIVWDVPHSLQNTQYIPKIITLLNFTHVYSKKLEKV